MIQALFCENGGHYYDRIATRGRQARSCVDHDGTGIPTKTYRAGSKAGEQAFAQRGGLLKERAAAPRSVPVRKVAGSDSGDKESRNKEAIERAIDRSITRDKKAEAPTLQTLRCAFAGHEWTRVPKRGTKPLFCPEHEWMKGSPVPEEDYPVSITLDNEFTYEPESMETVMADSLDPDEASSERNDHTGQFQCEICGEWKPRKSSRGRLPKTCDDCKATPAYQAEVYANQRVDAEDRGERVATRLEELLRTRGTHLSQNGDRFQLQRWVKGRTWTNESLTVDNWGFRQWMLDDDNAHLVKIKRLRWVKINEHELATV
jgi:hypothetical protein